MPKRTDLDEERRRSPRFNCGGQVRLNRLPSDGIILAGSIRDFPSTSLRALHVSWCDCGFGKCGKRPGCEANVVCGHRRYRRCSTDCDLGRCNRVVVRKVFYIAMSTTPAATSKAAIQRRRPTRSCRNIFAATALATKVREAEAGTTRLRFPHDRPKSRL